MKEILTAEECKKISDKIGEVEKTTAGELKVHVVGRSDSYLSLRLVASTVVGIAGGKILSLTSPMLEYYALELAVIVGLLAWVSFRLASIRRFIIPKSFQRRSVHHRAKLSFLDNGVYKTRDASGILIFISVFERRVEILADQGIHNRVGVDGWQKYLSQIIEGIRDKKAGDRIVDTLGAIGQELAAAFPPRPDDENELTDAVVITDS